MTQTPTIFFVNPPSGLFRRDDRCQSRVEDQTVNVVFPPIDLATSAAVARELGWNAVIRDYPAEAHAGRSATWDDCRRDIEATKSDALIINTTTATADSDAAAAEFLKAVRPDALAVARGESLHYWADDALAKAPALDAIVSGELEAILPRLLELVGSEDASPIEQLRRSSAPPPGVYFLDDDGALVASDEHPRVEDLDALPPPARDLLDNDLYRSPETGARLTVIQANRGCPAKCVFCPAGTMSGYRVRFRSPEKIVDEIRECVERYGVREFLFNGDTFTIRSSWVLELCERIIDAGLDIRWGCNSRVDTMDDQRARSLKAAGCWVVAFGVESGSQRVLDNMAKGATVDRAFEAVACVRRHGLLAHTFYIIGLPWETKETLAETLDFARRLDADFFDFNVAYPLPGTELYEIAQRDNLFEAAAPDESSYASAALRTYELSGEELTAWRKRALMSLYLRPRYILRTLGRIRSPRVFLNYVRAATKRFMSLVRR